MGSALSRDEKLATFGLHLLRNGGSTNAYIYHGNAGLSIQDCTAELMRLFREYKRIKRVHITNDLAWWTLKVEITGCEDETKIVVAPHTSPCWDFIKVDGCLLLIAPTLNQEQLLSIYKILEPNCRIIR